MPRAGDVLRLAAGPLRVIGVHDWASPAGWVWTDGWRLDRAGVVLGRATVLVPAVPGRAGPAAELRQAVSAGGRDVQSWHFPQ